jgi:hypothetical protein
MLAETLTYTLQILIMKTQIASLANKTREFLPEIVREIIRIADPEAILLLSATYNYRFTENIFVKDPLWDSWGGSYELLVLTDNSGKSWGTQEAFIRSCLPQCQNLKLQQKSIQEFNIKVESGEEYENFVLLNAMVSYYKGEIPLAFPGSLATA